MSDEQPAKDRTLQPSLWKALWAAFILLSVAVGWYAWWTLDNFSHIPAERALERQSALMIEVAAFRELERAYRENDEQKISRALVVLGASRSELSEDEADSDIRIARETVQSVMDSLKARTGTPDPGLGSRVELAITILESAALASNEKARVGVSHRNAWVETFRLSALALFTLLALGVVSMGVVLRHRLDDMRRLEVALTALRKGEEELHENRRELTEKTRMLQTTLDNIDQGFAVWDSGFRLVAFNAKCLDFWYHPAGVQPGMTMLHLLRHLAATGAFGDSAPSDDLAERNFDRVIAAGPESEEEFTLADGRIVYVKRYPMPDGGHASVYSDVTDERLGALALEQAKRRAERANQAKSDFLSAMSHELRTPLNGVLGFGQLLRDDPSHPLADRQVEAVDQILSAGRLLLDLINDVLDLAKIEAGRISMDIMPVDVNDLLADTVPLIETQARARDLTLDFPDFSKPGLVVAADHKRLRQVVLNLLSNAVKYNRDKGAVTLTVELGPVGTCRLSVADTGAGISEDKLDGLFEPFNRLGAENSEIEGTGIGLTICRELVESMGGELGVTTRPGDGSTFWVELPLADAVRHRTGSGPVITNALAVGPIDGRRTVLYVEDNPANRRMMEILLGDLNEVSLQMAETGEEGLLMVEESLPDLILLDINLPGMDGYEVLSKLRENQKTASIPVIAVTALAMDDEVQRGLEAGFDAYLSKPLDLPKTIDTIRGLLMNGSGLSS